ncbi:MAG: hypothetical protein OXH29_14620 [bacterium]|nr:hypothetical protein [bacterium]
MIPRIWAGLLTAALVIAGCGDSSDEPEAVIVETVDLDEIPTVAPSTESPTPVLATPTPTATPTLTVPPEPTPPPLPEVLVWPTFEPEAWPRTPDEAAAGFAQHVARGDRAAVPRPAVQSEMNATAELPGIAEDGSPFGLATTIHMQQVQLDDGSTAWIVLSARSPDIVVDSPAVGELLAGGTLVRGEGNGFEGTIVFQVEDQDGLLGMAIADGGALGVNHPFETQLPFDQRPASGDWAILVGYTTSAADGSLSALTMLPMRLVDGS